MLTKLNRKYDSIKEPVRFFVFMALMSPGLIMIGLSGVESLAMPQLHMYGYLYMVIAVIPRIFHVHGWFRD